MKKNRSTDYPDNCFKSLLIRFNKENNESLTMEEFCHAVFPSDFPESFQSKEPQQDPFLRYVKGDM